MSKALLSAPQREKGREKERIDNNNCVTDHLKLVNKSCYLFSLIIYQAKESSHPWARLKVFLGDSAGMAIKFTDENSKFDQDLNKDMRR